MTPEEVKDIQRWLEKSKGLADGRPFLGDRRLDALIDVLLELSAQVWMLKRRNTVLETILAEAGVISPKTIEDYPVSGDLKAALHEQRTAFVSGIFRSFSELPLESEVTKTNKEGA